MHSLLAVPHIDHRASPDLARVHYDLAQAYHDLGRRRYLSQELCLRILYHLEQAWTSVMEPPADPEQVSQLVDVARRAAEAYQAADADWPELPLLPDGVGAAEKHVARAAIAARIRARDAAHVPM